MAPPIDGGITDAEWRDAADRHQPPGCLIRPVEAHRPSDKAAKQRAGDPDQNRDDETTRVPSRDQELRNDSDDKPENDPRENTHSNLLLGGGLLQTEGPQAFEDARRGLG